jgi:hypothetical protein
MTHVLCGHWIIPNGYDTKLAIRIWNNNILIKLIKSMFKPRVYSDIPTLRRSGIIIAP